MGVSGSKNKPVTASLTNEYKGEICLEDEKLKVKYVKCSASKACLERMIHDVTRVEKVNGSQEKEKTQSGQRSKEGVKYICLQYGMTEEIPLSVVRDLDAMDDGDPNAVEECIRSITKDCTVMSIRQVT